MTVDELVQQVVEKLTVELLRGKATYRINQFVTGVTIGNVKVSTHLPSKKLHDLWDVTSLELLEHGRRTSLSTPHSIIANEPLDEVGRHSLQIHMLAVGYWTTFAVYYANEAPVI
jgi:hypothetical protein